MLWWRFWYAVIFCTALLAANSAKALKPGTRLAQYAHRSWRIGDAGLLGTPQDITQTRDGRIWVSTQFGLYEFDGVRFRKWNAPYGEALPGASFWHVMGADDGALYVGSDQGLVRIKDGHVFSFPQRLRWPGPFFQRPDGTVWTGISGVQNPPYALCDVAGNALNCHAKQAGLPCSHGMALSAASNGELLAGSVDGICAWNPETMRPGTAPEAKRLEALDRHPGAAWVTSLTRTTDGEEWAGLNVQGPGAGLLRFAGSRWMPYRVDGFDGSVLAVTSLLAEREGPLWIGSSREGIYKIFRGLVSHFDKADGLTDSHILAIFQDHEGSVWVITPKGIDFFRDYAVLSYSASGGFMTGHANTVAADAGGSVLLGSDILTQVDGSEATQSKDGSGRPVRDVQFVFRDSGGTIWINAGNRLLRKQPSGVISPVHGLPGARGRYIGSLTEDRAHDIWVSVEDTNAHASLLIQLRDGRIEATFSDQAVVGDQVLNVLAPNPKGGVWAGGAAHGLFWFHDGRFERALADGFNDRVENLATGSDGALWIVSPAGFLRSFQGQTHTLTAAAGLLCDGGVSLLDDGHGATWFYQHCGVTRVSNAELAKWWQHPKKPIHGQSFDALDGSRPNLFNGNPAETHEGRLWSASDYDFQAIDPRDLPVNTVPPPVQIIQIRAGGRDLLQSGVVTVPPRMGQIQITYTGFSFVIPERVLFRYQLQGYDKGWTDAGTRREAFYDDLAPGQYTFLVTACNNDGVWNQVGTQLKFIVLPAWYQRLWFRLLVILLFLCLFAAAYVYRLRRYSTLLQHRFDERLRERTRLARDLHDTLIQTIQGSKMVVDEAREHLEDTEGTARMLDRLAGWLGRASVEGRIALEALRGSYPEANDLGETLKRVAEDCASDSPMKIVLATNGRPRSLHPIASDEVYRIAYEAIRNAVAHSGASRLLIELEYKRRFKLRIHDNGKGIEESIRLSGTPGHFGLAGMRERTIALGGRFSITSRFPLRGTCIHVLLPGHAIYRPAKPPRMSRLLEFLRLRR